MYFLWVYYLFADITKMPMLKRSRTVALSTNEIVPGVAQHLSDFNAHFTPQPVNKQKTHTEHRV